MTSLDPYLEYLVENDPRYYYFLSEMEQVNHCMGKIEYTPCADLESFFRGGQNLITFLFLFLVYKGIEDPNTMTQH